MQKNWFDQGSDAYKAYRPQYPEALADYLASLTKSSGVVLDVGCGTGQLTHMLAGRFQRVIGTDPSVAQIKKACEYQGLCLDGRPIDYSVSTAEVCPVDDGCVDMVTAAQAAHWFNHDLFYQEVRRISRPGGIIALISYGVMRLPEPLNERFQQFYKNEIGPFWPPERVLVDQGYKTISFPFDEIDTPEITINLEWDLPAFLGYISTWSASRNAREQGHGGILHRFADDIEQAWGAQINKHPVTFPVNMRIGVIT